ncbi:MAG: protein kinase [Planctomycetes bacterium]|nr:protein kinase [Planctomycetota bacterium]
MSSLDFARVRRLVEAAHGLPREARAEWLARECGDDRALRDEVEELLRSAESSDAFLEPRSTPLPVANLVPPDLDLAPGTRVGGFRLTRRLAAGGMGTIWEAEQDEPHRRVALKTLRFGFGSAEAVRRFRHEAEILARLRHPHVAQVYASGVHGDGLPWYAMEFIEDARSLTEHARVHGLGLRARLALFVDLCDTVQHGHERGVIHRDLKPNNVLVDGHGRVKVIDFGVARLRANDGTPSSFVTEAGRVLGTLPYMSPEQIGGTSDGIDVRSDVYALGVVLFELLTYELPFDVANASLAEAARILTDATPPRPSTRSADVPVDLDAIVFKALEKDRTRRYPSALALAADVQRFLRGEPVEAQRPSVRYQLRMFARRHRALVVSFGVVLGVLLAATIVSALFAVDARRAERRSTDAAADALEQRNVARLQQYTADLYAAYGALRGLDIATARQRLESCPSEYRGFEWWHLLRRAESALWTRAVLSSEVRGVVWHPDGTRVFVSTREGRIEARDPTSGAVLDEVALGDELVGRMAITSDGEHLVATTTRGRVFVLSTTPLCEEHSWSTGDSALLSCAVDARDERLATSSWVGRVSVWTLAGERLAAWKTDSATGSISFSRDGAWLAVGTSTTTSVLVFDAATGATVARLGDHTGYVSRVLFTPDGKTLVSASHDQTLRVWDVPSFTLRGVLRGHGDLVWDIDVDQSGRRLASVGWDRTLRVWDLDELALASTELGHGAAAIAVALSPDGTRAVSADMTSRLFAWKLGAGDPRVTRVKGKWTWTLRAFPDSKSILAIHGGFATRFEAPSGKELVHYAASDAEWRSAAVAPDGESVLLGNTLGYAEGWSADGQRRIARAHVDDAALTALAWLAGGERFVAVAQSGLAYVGDAALGSIEQIADVAPSLSTVAAHPREPIVALGGRAGRLVFVDPLEKRELFAAEPLHAEIVRLAWSPDGARVGLALGDGRIVIWNYAARAIERVLDGHEGAANDVLFTADGERVVSCAVDRTVRFWDLTRGAEMAVFGDHTNSVQALASTPDGATIVSGSLDSSLRWWDAGPKAWQTVEKLKPTHFLARDLRAAIQEDAALADGLRVKALELAESSIDDPSELAREAWLSVRSPGAARTTLEHALELARTALRHLPNDPLARAVAWIATARLGLGGERASRPSSIDEEPLLAIAAAYLAARVDKTLPSAAELAELRKPAACPPLVPPRDLTKLVDELRELSRAK